MLVDIVGRTTVSEKAARVASVAGHISKLAGVTKVVSLLAAHASSRASISLCLPSALVSASTVDNVTVATVLVDLVGKIFFQKKLRALLNSRDM